MSDTCKADTRAATGFLREIMERSGQDLLSCYQCRRCAAGCPVGIESGMTPDRLIRLIVMGLEKEALENTLVWRCLSCYTCGTRCPNNIQTSSINEALKHMAKERGLKPLLPRVKHFHDAFMDTGESTGRLNEIVFMQKYETRSAISELSSGQVGAVISDAINQAKLGLTLMSRKRMHFGSERIKRSDEIKRLYEKAHKIRKIKKLQKLQKGSK